MSRLKKQKEQVEETEIEEEELKTAVLIFAHYLGINIDNEAELLYIAEDALKKLPKGWELGIGDGDDNGGIPYFFNGETGESRWKHPDEIKIMEKVKLEQRKLKETKKQNKHRDKDKNTEKNTNSSSAIETKKGKPSCHSIASNISSVDVLDVKDLSDDDIETEIGTNKPSVRQLSVNSTSKSNDKTLGKSSTWLSSRSSNLKTELKSSTGSKIESTEDSEHIRRLHKRELDELKEYLNTTENSLREERSKRMALELELGSTRSTLELQSRKQSAEHETKLIELREEINMNNKSKRLLLEQRFESEVEALRTDLELHKSRLNETERERDAAKVQAAVGRLNDEKYQESLLELQELRIKLKADTDKANGALDSEKKCLQSEVSDLNDKLAVALHERSILRADLDQAITRATSFSGEKDSLQMALSEAVQKLQTQENRHRQLEDEIAALRRDIKNQTDELNAARKAIAENLGPSSATTKSNIEDEVAKLRMKVAETDAINQALRDDVDKSFAREAASVREVEIKLDKSQFESRRLEGLISEAQAKADADSVRRTVLERELAAAEDEGFKKERALREERHRVESLEAAKVRWDEARALLEEEVTMIKQELSHEKAQAVREIERIRTEVEAKLPQLANSAVEQMHSVVADRVQQGVNSNVQRFTQDVAALEKEIKHSEALIANKENEYLTRLTEAKARELALKDQCDQLQRRNQDLASQVPSSIRAIPGSPPHSSFTTPEQMQANPNARYEVQPRTLPNDLYSYIHATAFHDPLESAMVSINQQLESLRAQLSFAFNTPSLYSTHRSFPLLHHSPPKDWSSMPSLSLLTPPLSRAIEPVPGFSKYDASTQKLRWKMEQQQNRLRQQIGSFNVFTSPNSAYCQQQQQGAPQWQQRFANLQSQFDALNQRLDASQRGSDAETISPVSPSNVSPETDSEVDLTRNERYVSTSEFGHPLSSVDTSILFTDFNGGFHPNYWKAKYLPNRK